MIRKICFQKYFYLLSFFFFTIYPAQKKFAIVLDAGHGGSDHGATRRYDDIGVIAEKDVTLAVTLKVGAALEKNKDFKVIYTRKTDIYPSLLDRTNLANRSKADLFVSIHVNASRNSSAYGTETFVQGPDQNKTNLEVAKAENSVIYLDAQDKATFASYDPTSPESLIALKIQQSKYLESSLLLGGFIEENFVKKDNRFSRGVKQQNLHVLRMNAMPSVLIEMGFLSNHQEAQYLASEKGQDDIAQSIINAIISYKALRDKKMGYTAKPKEPEKPKEQPLRNDLRILLMTSPNKINYGDPALKGLNNVLILKEGNFYKYFFGKTNFASIRDANLKTAKEAGFRNAVSISFTPNQILANSYYTLEVYAGAEKLKNDNFILQTLKNVEREKQSGMFYYTYGKVKTLEEAIKLQEEVAELGIKNTVIQKK